MKPTSTAVLIVACAAALTATLWRNALPLGTRQAAHQVVLPAAHIESAVTQLADANSARQNSSPNAPAKAHPGKTAKVHHEPQQPKSGEPVRITVKTKELPLATGGLVLEYQVVEPGRYVALRDAAFQKNWISQTMNPAAAGGPDQADAGIVSAEIPASVQRHRRLIRYRIRSATTKKVVAPAEEDAEPNFAYFVYDGVPAWKGAVDPRSGSSKLREATLFSSDVMQSVPVYHFLSSKAAVEKVTWSDSDGYGDSARNSYKYTGTMVYNGVVYDHVGFRARGGGWRHAMGKNMWKFNFPPGHRFQAYDDYGQPYKAKWDKLNLGACIQQGDYGMRGEQGLFEAVGFRLFNMAGIEAPETHWVTLRIIDEAEENPSDQYRGDFWGLYLAVENVDQHFLKEHDLPPGNLYKMEFGAKTAFNGNPAVTNQSDIVAFTRGLRRQTPEAWWLENVDLPRYYNYRAILECIHHYDIDSGKNYFYYLNPKTAKWAVVPWDIDLTWGEGMFGGGREPFYAAGLISRAPFKQQYQERLAEIRDLLFNADEMGRLLDEYASIISDPNGGASLADADRAKWDYHPVFTSQHVMSMKTSPGLFYFRNPRNRFPVMVNYMKTYATRRAGWIDSRLLSGYQPPSTPKIQWTGDSGKAGKPPTFQVEGIAAGEAKLFRWRLAEITDPKSPAFDRHKPWKHEIDPIWESEGKELTSATIPADRLVQGHTYRVRARYQNEQGAWSRWSTPVQLTIAAPGG